MSQSVWSTTQQMALEAMDFSLGAALAAGAMGAGLFQEKTGLSDTSPTMGEEANGNDSEALAWQQLEQEVHGCTRCGLCHGRSQTVLGTGDRHAALLLVGEAPGAEEDRQGKPFVGRAGQLLTRMLAVIGIQRDEVYITNTVKCRPPENRKPTPMEMAACRPYLERQIALVQPRLLVALGGVAAQSLLGNEQPISRLRGAIHAYNLETRPETIALIATYHPAFLLRSPQYKKEARADLDRIRDFLDGAS